MTQSLENTGIQKLTEVISGKSLRLSIRGLGPVPSLKNSKRAIWDKRTGHIRTLTDKRVAKWMKSAIQSFDWQLMYAMHQAGLQTSTMRMAHLQIVSLLPLSDSRQWISEIVIRNVQVPKGEEGADILIEVLRKAEE